MGKNITSSGHTLAYRKILLHFCRVISQSNSVDFSNYLIFNALLSLNKHYLILIIDYG
jgi:IS4 transposase